MTVTTALADPLTASVILETNYPGINKATIWRYLDGVPTEVRGYTLKETGAEVPPTRDYEAPLGVQIGYASLNWTTTKPAPPALPEKYVTINVADTVGWIKFPAHPEQNFPMECITELPERNFGGNSETFRIIGRAKPIAIHDVMTWWEGEIKWICPSKADHERQVLTVTQGSICMVQTMPAYGSINEYVVVEDLSTAHIGPSRVDLQQRLMTLAFQTIDQPVGMYSVSVTYTYTDAKGDWATYGSPPTPAVTSVLRNYPNYYTFYLNDPV